MQRSVVFTRDDGEEREREPKAMNLIIPTTNNKENVGVCIYCTS